MIKFEVGKKYEFSGLYTPSYNMTCISTEEHMVVFTDGDKQYIFEIERDEFTEKVLVWEYKGHQGYCYANCK